MTIGDYLASAGLTPPQTSLTADPDGDGRDNLREFLEQTAPNTPDTAVSTIWLYDDGGAGELRFALPANVDQDSFVIHDKSGTPVFTPDSGLTLDAQCGPFFVYKPVNPVSSPAPGHYTISIAGNGKRK